MFEKAKVMELIYKPTEPKNVKYLEIFEGEDSIVRLELFEKAKVLNEYSELKVKVNMTEHIPKLREALSRSRWAQLFVGLYSSEGGIISKSSCYSDSFFDVVGESHSFVDFRLDYEDLEDAVFLFLTQTIES